VNKRKAIIGWLVYTAAKPIAKRALRSKAKSAVPGKQRGSRKPNVAALVAGAGALVGGLLFWRSRRDDDGSAGGDS
jgi:hypothetical protein